MSDWTDIGTEPMELAGPMKQEKYYPHLDIDLKKFPELSKDIGDECTFFIKGRVVSKRLDENAKTQCIEVRAISTETESINEADKVLKKLRKY